VNGWLKPLMDSAALDSSALKDLGWLHRESLACMSRAEAFDIVRQRGGTPSPTARKVTKLLIVGELGSVAEGRALAQSADGRDMSERQG
jgi:hypothetical protein